MRLCPAIVRDSERRGAYLRYEIFKDSVVLKPYYALLCKASKGYEKTALLAATGHTPTRGVAMAASLGGFS